MKWVMTYDRLTVLLYFVVFYQQLILYDYDDKPIQIDGI